MTSITHISGLNKVSSNKQVFLVRRYLDIVRSDDGLILVRVVKAFDILKVGDVKGSNVVSESNGEVGELSIVGDVRINGRRFFGLVAEINEKLSSALVAVLVLAEGVNNPHLTWTHGCPESSRLGMTGNELDILNTTSLVNRSVLPRHLEHYYSLHQG